MYIWGFCVCAVLIIGFVIACVVANIFEDLTHGLS